MTDESTNKVVEVAREHDTKQVARIIIDAAKEHQRLYDNYGLLSFTMAHGYEKEIHIRPDFFEFDALPGDVVEQRRTCTKYPWQYSKTFEGYTFYFITRERIPEYAKGK